MPSWRIGDDVRKPVGRLWRSAVLVLCGLLLSVLELCRMKRSLILPACVWISSLGVLPAQTLQVTPAQVLVDECAIIRASGLQPNEHVSIRGELTDGAGQAWASEAEFIADAQGMVDVSKQSPIKGSYDELSALGLVWSMRPAEKDVNSYVPPPDLGTQKIQFRLLRGGQEVSSAQFDQRHVSESVHQITLEGQLHGVLFLPKASGRVPGVLVLGGSEGGRPIEKAAWLASHGYAALALAYFRDADLPRDLEAIPLEYFGTALAWMMKRPEMLPDRIAVVGTSRGGELALQLGSMYPQIAAVVAYVPANVLYPACCGNTRVPYAWTRKGEPLAYVPFGALRNPDPVATMRASIPVEHIRGPVLLVSGQDDGVWSSSRMANAIVVRLKDAHFSQRVEHLDYAHAGHRAGRPEIVPTWHRALRHPVSGQLMNPGGSPKGDAESSIDGIGKVLQFLALALQTPSLPDQQFQH